MTADLIRAAREATGTQKLFDLRSKPPQKEVVYRLVDAYVAWAEVFERPPPKSPGSLRPIVAPVTGMAPVDEVDFALKSLLVADSVAISITDTVSYMGRLARLLVLLEAHIENGLVILIPEAKPGDGCGYWEYLNTLNKREPGSLKDKTPEEKIEAITTDLQASEMAMALDLCSMYPEAIDLASRNSWQMEVIRMLMDGMGTLSTGMESVDRLHFLPSLLTQRLPLLSLSVEDAVAIRNDGVFDVWRKAIEASLRRIAAVDEADLLDPDGAMRRELRDAMSEAQADLEHTFGKSALLKRRQIGVMSFGVSCVAGGLGALGGPVSAAIAAGSASVASTFVQWLGGRPSSGQRAFRRMVIQLTE